jgi:hypothetical protein
VPTAMSLDVHRQRYSVQINRSTTSNLCINARAAASFSQNSERRHARHPDPLPDGTIEKLRKLNGLLRRYGD